MGGTLSNCLGTTICREGKAQLRWSNEEEREGLSREKSLERKAIIGPDGQEARFRRTRSARAKNTRTS